MALKEYVFSHVCEYNLEEEILLELKAVTLL